MTWSTPGYEAVAHVLGRRTGLYFSPARTGSAELGIRRAMARAGLTDLGRYRDLVAGSACALDDLIVELTVGETYFFREPAHFGRAHGDRARNPVALGIDHTDRVAAGVAVAIRRLCPVAARLAAG